MTLNVPLLAVLIAGSSVAIAQSYPAKAIRLIVPFGPGGGTDLVARTLAARLTELLGQTVVVENRAGASGVIGMETVAKASADGYTLVLGSAGPLSINPSLYPKLPYDPLRDFAPISLVTNLSYLLVVHPSLPVKSVKELIALAKARPGQLNYGSPGNGSTTHLATELLKVTTGIDMVHVPYKGVAAAATDLIGGQLQVMSGDLNTMLPHVKSGRMRGIAVTAAKRSTILPAMPTVAESGIAGFEATGWMGVLAPASTPAAAVERLHGAITNALAVAETRARLEALGGDVAARSPTEFAAHIRSEISKWGKLIKMLGLKLDQR